MLTFLAQKKIFTALIVVICLKTQPYRTQSLYFRKQTPHALINWIRMTAIKLQSVSRNKNAILSLWCSDEVQYLYPYLRESFCVCTHPMRDNITLKCHLSLAGHIHKMIPDIHKMIPDVGYFSDTMTIVPLHGFDHETMVLWPDPYVSRHGIGMLWCSSIPISLSRSF